MRFDFRRSVMETYSGAEVSGRTLYIEALGLSLKITLARR